MASTDPTLTHCDSGGIVTGWLVKLSLVLGVLAVVLFDVISVGTARMQVSDQADTAARAGSETWANTRNVRTALAQAEATSTQSNPSNVVDPASFQVERDGTVHLRLHRTASTLVLHRIKPLRSWGKVASDGRARFVQ